MKKTIVQTQIVETWRAAPLAIFIILNLSFTIYNSQAQDIHFSQYNQTPLMINPALAGAFNGDQRAILNYKNQWKEFGTSYKTSMFSVDGSLFKGKWKNSNLGAGLTFFNDKAGDLGLGITKVNLSVASHIAINEQNRFSSGVMAGFGQSSMDFTSAQWGSQFVGGTYNSSFSSGEMPYSESYSYMDVSAGVLWNYARSGSDNNNSQFRVNGGLSLFHMNKPKQKISENGVLSPKIILHGGSNIGISFSSYTIKPSFILMKQATSSEFTFGTMVRHAMNEGSRYTGFIKSSAFLFGGYLRAGDSFITCVGFEHSFVAIGVSYDSNISKLGKAAKGTGGMEISLRFVNPSPFKTKASSVKFL